MTIRITFAQRQILDRLLKAGDKGICLPMTPTTACLVKEGYAEWAQKENEFVPLLKITLKGKAFYPSQHHD